MPQANGRNQPTAGESCDSALLQRKSVPSGPTPVAAASTGNSKPAPAASGDTRLFRHS
jgi:hypothetical protein